MRIKETHISNRVLAGLLAFVMLFSMIPVSTVLAAESASQYGSVKAATGAPNIIGNETENTTADYSEGVTLQFSEKNPDAGRSTDGWWAGIYVTTPSGVDATQAKYQSYSGTSGWSADKSFWSNKDSADNAREHFIGLWCLVNQTLINEAKAKGLTKLEYKWQFNWDADDTFEQTVSMVIDITTVELMKNGTLVYPTTEADKGDVSALAPTDLIIEGNKEELVSVTLSDPCTLVWYKADPSIGRMNDGWWVGIKMSAPAYAGATEADFSKVSYQTGVGEGWSGNKSFWDNQDSPKVDGGNHYITLWGCVTEDILNTAKSGSKNVVYRWRFDWDKDGDFEQQVVLNISPNNITLVKDGVQTYPGLGTVSAFTGSADINGNATGNVIVSYKAPFELSFSKANSVIGRVNDGWWTGIKVTAPVGFDLSGAKYQTFNGNTNDWSEEKSFWANKDSADADSLHYIGLWGLLNESILENATNEGKNVEYKWRFDWNHDGVYEQLVVYSIDPSLVTLKKDNQASLTFEKGEYPDAVFFGDEFVNKASGGTVSGTIIYISSNEDTATVDSEGKLNIKKSGEVTITATLAGNEYYNEVSASYTLMIYKADQKKEFLFNKGAGDKEIAYGEEFENHAFGGENNPISYKSSDESVATVDENGKVTTLKAGTVIITAINPTDDRYNQKEISYRLTVKLADPELKFENGTTEIPAITYGDSYKNTASTSAPVEIIYSSSDALIAEVADDGTLIIHKAGTVTITATTKETEQYKSVSLSYEITINKATQLVTWEKGTNPTVTFNDNDNRFVNAETTNAIENSEEDIDVTYALVMGQNLVADFDAKTGSFTILGAGVISVSVAFDGNDRYKQALSSYTLTVDPDDQIISFPEQAYEVTTGEDFAVPVATESGEKFGTGVITYAIKGEDNDGVIKTLNKDTGAIELTYKAGSVTIIATKAADANYNETTAEYTLTVNEWKPVEKYYTLTGSTKNDSGWFTGNVSVEAKDGYVVSYVKENGEADWKKTLEDAVVSDGDNNIINFYVKDTATGYISNQQTEIIKKDIVFPQAEIKFAELTSWEKFLTIITFGIWEKDTAEFTVEYSDQTSDVQKVEYYIADGTTDIMSEGELENVSDWAAYAENVISVEKDKKFVLYAKVTDNAGNVTYATTNGIVFDRTAPEIKTEIKSVASNGFYNGDVEVNVIVTDATPYSGIQSVKYWIITDEKETTKDTIYQFVSDNPEYKDLVSVWNSNDDSKNIIIDSIDNNSDNVTLYIEAIDNAGNSSVIEIPLQISATKPTIQVDFGENKPDKIDTYKDVDYYDSNRTAEIKITGRTSVFDESNVIIAVTAVNAKGEKVDGSYSISEWTTIEGETKDSATHTAYITFTGNATYSFMVDYTDTALNAAKQYASSAFAVDHDEPEGTVTIDETTWSELIKTLTFGLWKNNKVEVSVTTDDKTSPIKSVEYYKTSLTRALTTTELENGKVNGYDIDWTDFAKFPNPIDVDELFTVYLRVTDYAGHTTYLSGNGYIVDMTESNIALKPAEANENGYYKSNVPVEITVVDSEPYSGIDIVEYWIERDGIETKRETLYDFDIKEPSYDQLKSILNKTITVDAEANNSDNVVVWVKTVDNAGNESTNSVSLKIDVTHPKIDISFNTDSGNVVGDRGYFKTNRVATVKFTERTSTFNREKATEGIKFSGVDSQGKEVTLDRDAMIEWLETKEGATPDQAVHTARVHFTVDANYTFSVSYTDEAGNANDEVTTGKSVTPHSFTVDKNDPTATITATEKTWNKLLEVLTFGIWKNEDVIISAMADDVTSPVTVEYYKTPDAIQKTSSELDEIPESEWNVFNGLTITEDEQLVVYLKVTDHAGNYIYINADGIIVDKTASNLTVDILTTVSGTHFVEGGNNIPVYNKDVELQIKVNEPTPYSGINKVEYWITCDGNGTKRETLYTFDKTAPAQAELLQNFEQVITVSSKDNNSCDVQVSVQVTDNAGNVKMEVVSLDIDITPPTIEINYDNNAPYKTVGTHGYFPNTRKATVIITERAAHFNADDATNGITITVNNAADNDAGKKLTENPKSIIGKWNTNDNKSKDLVTHTAVIDFGTDANYTFGIEYTDTANNRFSAIDSKDSVTPYQFTVDTTKPTGTVKVGELGTWDKLIEILTFGLWSRDTVSVTGTSADVTSPIESVSYFKTNETTAKTEKELDNVSWQEFKGFDVSPDEQFVVYLRIVDYAGNTTYISTNGVIVDKVAPVFEADAPEVHFAMPETINGFYTGDVSVGIKVIDPKKTGTNDAYSGLKEVRYEILNLGEITETGTLLSFDKQNPTQAELVQNIERTVVIKAAENNSNDVEIRVYAVDNAGNEYVDGSKHYASEKLKIDITDPTIAVTYDNNNGDTTFTDGIYFKANRTATIVVTERNFDPDKVVITLTNTDGIIPKFSGWTTTPGTNNGDDTTHTATLVYDADGDYTFDISCKDMCERSCDSLEVDYGTSLAPKAFTIDKTVPIFTVQYDNNDSLNGNYYKAQRIATITVTEHNFETSRVNIKLTATDDGNQAQLPTVSGWASNGDVHTATITYAADSLYTFDFDYMDKAGNAAADIAEQTFYVDKTAPALSITGVANQSANNGDVIPVISYSDTNYDAEKVTITLTGANRKEVKLDGNYADQHNGRIFTFNNFAKEKGIDDIYTLAATLTDKAGNTSTETIVFSVNRFGSTYVLDAAAEKLNNSYVKEPIDVVVTETNANELKNIGITLYKNDQTLTLKEGEDYKIDVVGGNGQWYQYTYTVFAKNFADDGVYRLVIHSEDAAGNIAENILDTKDKEISFGVDATNPTIVIANLENGKTYAVDGMTVEMTIKDNLRLAEVIVELDGKKIKSWSGDELNAIIENGGNFTFDISGDSTLAHNLVVYAIDAAGNGKKVSDNELPANAATISDFFVTTNLWVRYYTNKPLFFGSIGGVIGVAALIIFLVVFMKKKKEKEGK